jgi:hypothetical protein
VHILVLAIALVWLAIVVTGVALARAAAKGDADQRAAAGERRLTTPRRRARP